MNKVYLLLGSNIGDSNTQIKMAISHLKKQVGKAVRYSPIYITKAWGNVTQPDFLNQIVIVETTLNSLETLNAILLIEKKMGRIRTVKNAPRIIDIDILFFNKEVVNHKKLIIPHPEIANRKFVLIPLNALSPNFKHPVFQQNIHHLLKICKDNLEVTKM